MGSSDYSNEVFEEEAERVFEGVTFREKTDFKMAIFKERANFRHATFEETVDFRDASFEKGANFRDATFKKGAMFTSVMFIERAEFEGAIFEGLAKFGAWDVPTDATIFRKIANFSDAVFKGKAEFVEVTFREKADFEETTFGEEARFGGVTFNGEADFTGVSSDIRPDFNGTRSADEGVLPEEVGESADIVTLLGSGYGLYKLIEDFGHSGKEILEEEVDQAADTNKEIADRWHSNYVEAYEGEYESDENSVNAEDKGS